MTYEQAFNIGSKVEGYVKCTYAMLYSEDKRRAFSFQHRDASHNRALTELNNAVGATAVDWATANSDESVNLLYDVPICVTNAYVPGEKLVPVKMTDYANEIINRKIDIAFSKYKGSNNPVNDRNWYNTNKRWEELHAALEADNTFYVKECAIDWCPTNIHNVTVTDPTTGQLIRLSDAIAAAEERLQKAKTLLIASGLTVFI